MGQEALGSLFNFVMPASGVYVNLENAEGVADYSLYVGSYNAAVTYRQDGA